MKNILLAIAISLITTATVIGDASAQESRGARFNFAPNVWKTEQPRLPRGHEAPMHAVRNGSVPKGSDFLGVDPGMLTRPPAPPPPPVYAPPAPRQSVQAVPRFPQTTAQFVPKPAFNPSFGTPMSAMPQQVPQQPVAQQPVAQQPAASVAQSPAPARAPQPLLAKTPIAKPAATAAKHRTVAQVHGQLQTKPRPTGASGAPQALSYENGYVPGGSLAGASAGASGHGVADVRGRVLPSKALRY